MFHQCRLPGPRDLGQAATVLERGRQDPWWALRCASIQACRRGKLPFRLCFVHMVECDKGHIGSIGRQHRHGDGANVLNRLGLARQRSELAEHAQASLAQHPRRRFGHRREHAADARGFIANRTVGEGEVALLDIAGAIQWQQLFGGPRDLPAGQHVLEHGADETQISGQHCRPRWPRAVGCTVARSIGR